jgi:outer membrane protein assembly factor BamB
MRVFAIVLVLALAATQGVSEEVVKSFPAPGGYYAYGLTFDGTDLWCAELLNGTVSRVDTATGGVLATIPGPKDDNQGLTWDGTHLWYATSWADGRHLYRMTTDGTVVDSIPCPARGSLPYAGGLTWDGSNLWVSVYYEHPAQIYKVDPSSGAILDSIRPMGEQPQGLAWDSAGPFLWNCMDNNDGDLELIWKFNATTGETLLSFPVPDSFADKRPRGMAWDGQYLWTVSKGPGGDQYIYQIDVGGSGYPLIHLSEHSHDYGHTVVGVGDSWQLVIGNVGTADLIIDSLSVDQPEFSFSGTYPRVLPVDSTFTVDVDFMPSDYGYFSATLSVHHSDPINPVQIVDLTGFGIHPAGEIQLPDTLHDWGDIRVSASKRWFMRVVNQGVTPLTLDSLTFSDTHFFLWENIFPVVVDSTDSAEIPVWFSPADGSPYSGTLTLYSDDSDEPAIDVSVQGTGDPTPYPGGRPFWTYEAHGDIFRHVRSIRWIPDINGDAVNEVIAVSENDTLYCLHGNGSGTGDVLWTYEVSYVYSDRAMIVVPDIDGDSVPDVVIGTAGGDRSVRAISGADGQHIWRYDTHEYGGGGWVYEVSMMVDIDGDDVNDILAGAGGDGGGTGPSRAYLLSGTDGTKIWERPVNAAVFGIREIGDLTGDLISDVACGTGDTDPAVKGVYALDGLTGDVLWYYNIGTGIWSVCPIGDLNGDDTTDVLAGGMSGVVYALDGVSGSELWTTTVGGIIEHVWTIPDVDGDGHDDVLPSGTMSHFHCLGGDSGHAVWYIPSGQMAFVNVPMDDITGDTVWDCIAGSGFSTNIIYCLDGATGDTLWTRSTASAVETGWPIPSIDANGYQDVLIGTREGMIYAISGGEPEIGIAERLSDKRRVRFRLLGGYPNPFSDETVILLAGVAPNEPPEVLVYDTSGRLVTKLASPDAAGAQWIRKYVWQGTDSEGRQVPTGVYFCQVRSGEERAALKILRLK